MVSNKSDSNSLAISQAHAFKALPVPRPNRTSYRFNRWLALGLSPHGITNYLRFLLAPKRTEIIPYTPVRIDIEPVSRCNFRCTMCAVSTWPGQRRGQDMSPASFKHLLGALPGLVEMKLQGLGEPLLGGDEFIAMIRHARFRHIWVRTTVNASLLNVNNNYMRLIDSGVNEVQISFDGTTKETFEKIRRGAKFERIVENCRLINSYCNELGIQTPRMWVLLQRLNVGEFFDFVKIGHELGFKRMTYSLDVYTWAGAVDTISASGSITPEMARVAVEMGRALDMEVTFWQLTSRYRTGNPLTVCPWPFERAFISSDMRIVPCCIIGDPNLADLGDAHDFVHEWNGRQYQAFRRAHLDGRIPEVCKACYESE